MTRSWLIRVIFATVALMFGAWIRPRPRRQASYYDRDAGIVFIRVAELGRHGWCRGWRRRYVDHSDEREWGLIDIAEGTAEEVTGFELWRPREMLPADLLDALSDPPLTRWLWINRDYAERGRLSRGGYGESVVTVDGWIAPRDRPCTRGKRGRGAGIAVSTPHQMIPSNARSTGGSIRTCG